MRGLSECFPFSPSRPWSSKFVGIDIGLGIGFGPLMGLGEIGSASLGLGGASRRFPDVDFSINPFSVSSSFEGPLEGSTGGTGASKGGTGVLSVSGIFL